MRNLVIKTVLAYATLILAFFLDRAVFISVYHDLTGADLAGHLDALWHGIAMDASVAGYFTAAGALVAIIRVWSRGKIMKWVERIYWLAVSVLLGMIFVLDAVLYGYWGFRLDTTPLFYFMSAPGSAMASAEPEFIVLGLTLSAAVATALCFALWGICRRFVPSSSGKVKATIAGVLLMGLLFIPIRGGVTVSTMNLSRAYFSQNPRLNHVAVNPVFSLMNSFVRQRDFGSQYRYMSDSQALAVFDSMLHTESKTPEDSLLITSRPDIYMVVLESFSSHLMKSLGGKDVATGLDSIAREGILFTNFHANSFRTDRALPSILSAFPAQPSMSLVKYSDKTEHLPSLARELADAGYECGYYYGGDINYANFKSYLVSGGFSHIISDADFSIAEKASKWGAHDHLVYRRMLEDINRLPGKGAPQFMVIQTSSSHEPFDVPYHSQKWKNNPRANAFAYADSCLTDFVARLQTLPRGRDALVVIVPDHYGAWPENIEDPVERHRIPLVLTGGALCRRGFEVARLGTQTDIAATLLSQMGLPSDRFPFSRDLLNASSPDFAWFSPSGKIVMVTPTDTVVYDTDADHVDRMSGSASDLVRAKAWLQIVFDKIAEL